MLTLLPPAEQLSTLLIRMCQEPWPTTEEDRERYFSALQLTDSGPAESSPSAPDPDTQARDFTTALAGPVTGLYTVFRDQFLGLALFAYSELKPNGEPAREGYAALQRLLSQGLGDPVEEGWGTPSYPAYEWRTGALTLDLYCFQERDSGIMIDLSHSERSAAYEAATSSRL